MGPARIYPWRKMRRSRAPSIAPGTFVVAPSWADCITNMHGFNLRQAQVQTLAPDRSDQPFGKAVLPRRGRCNWLVSDTHGTQSARDDSTVDSISISDHIARSAIPRKTLGDLTCDPLRRRVGCDEISAIKPDDDEAIQQLKANGRHYEQIHGGDVRRVVSQKGPPFLTWRPASLDHILGDT